eukprot:12351527-Alexandrium_andersonii.AAC.1
MYRDLDHQVQLHLPEDEGPLSIEQVEEAWRVLASVWLSLRPAVTRQGAPAATAEDLGYFARDRRLWAWAAMAQPSRVADTVREECARLRAIAAP